MGGGTIFNILTTGPVGIGIGGQMFKKYFPVTQFLYVFLIDISLRFGVHDNQILLYFRIPDHRISLHFGVLDNLIYSI